MTRAQSVTGRQSLLSKIIQRVVFVVTFAAVFGDVMLYRSEAADPGYVGTMPALILGVIIVAVVCALVAVSVAADRRVKAAAVRRVEVRQPVSQGSAR